MSGVIVLLVVIVLVLWVLASCIRIVPQAYAVVLERLGAYKATWSTGIHFKVPFIERVARRVNLKEQVVDFPPQPVITKDNVTMRIDTVVFYQITDPKMFCYGVANPIMAIENLTISKSAEVGYAREIPISFRKIRITTARTTTIPASYGKSGATAASAGTANTSSGSSGRSGSGGSGSGSGSGSSSGNSKSSILYGAAKSIGLIS